MGHQRANKALHLTAMPLRSIAAGELGRLAEPAFVAEVPKQCRRRCCESSDNEYRIGAFPGQFPAPVFGCLVVAMH